MPQFLVRRLATQAIEYLVNQDDTDPNAMGPFDPEHPAPTIIPACEPGCELIRYAGPVNLMRPTPTSTLRWIGAEPAWVEEGHINDQRERKVEAMSQCCADAILAGFVSSALGTAYTYPAKLTDQANLTASVVASMLPGAGPEWATPFWCMDAAGEWAFRMHTAAQIQQVGADAKTAVLTCMTINEQLRAQIMVASANDLADIRWPA